MSDSLWVPWTAACQASLFFTNSSWSLLKVFSNKLALHIRWSKYWNSVLSLSPSNEYSRLISFSKLFSPFFPFAFTSPLAMKWFLISAENTNTPGDGKQVHGGSDGKECLQCRRPWFDPWVRKIPWRKKCNPLQYSCLENSMDRGAWWATVRGVAKSRTWLND